MKNNYNNNVKCKKTQGIPCSGRVNSKHLFPPRMQPSKEDLAPQCSLSMGAQETFIRSVVELEGIWYPLFHICLCCSDVAILTFQTSQCIFQSHVYTYLHWLNCLAHEVTMFNIYRIKSMPTSGIQSKANDSLKHCWKNISSLQVNVY